MLEGASLNNYDITSGKEISQGGYLHAIYFNEDYISLENSQDEINKLCNKFANPGKLGIINAYLGSVKVKGHNFDDPSDGNFSAGSRTPRTLKEFEYFGNTYDDTYGDTQMHFETSAKSSYDKYPTEFNNLSDREKDSLNDDEDLKQLAKNDRRIEFIDPETQKIIFSVVNDRQYNA